MKTYKPTEKKLSHIEFTDSDEEKLSLIGVNNPIRTKTIISGDYIECSIYIKPTIAAIIDNKSQKPKGTSPAQANLNKANAIKRLIRLANTNFTDNDVWGILSYAEEPTYEESQKHMKNFIIRLKRYIKSNSLPDLKYIYVTEGEKVRLHHNFITNFTDRITFEKLWGQGHTSQKHLVSEEDGYGRLIRYMIKNPIGKKIYIPSQNLEKPIVLTADSKITQSQINKIRSGDLSVPSLVQNIYREYEITDHTGYRENDFTGFMITANLKKKKSNKPQRDKYYGGLDNL